MIRFRWLAQLIGLDTIPVVGVFRSAWSDATAIAFYWCETTLVIVFVSLRLILHRRATNTRGHFIEQHVSINDGPWKRSITSYNRSFLTTAVGFSLGNLIFLGVTLGLFSSAFEGGEVDLVALRQGIVVALGFLTVGFAIDAPWIGDRSFLWVRHVAEGALSRVFVLYLAIFVGLFCAFALDVPRGMFAVFFGLKLFTDVASNFKFYDPERPPGWLRKIFRDPSFEEQWRADSAERRKSEAEDEEPFDGRPSTGRAAGTSMRARAR